MTQITLKVTEKELDRIIQGGFEDRFKVSFNDIPLYLPGTTPAKGETHRDYIEDDGREYRIAIFKDEKTGIEYNLNYTYNTEFPNDFYDLEGIELVKNKEESELYVAPAPKPVPEKSQEQLADEALWVKYNALAAAGELVEVVPKQRIKVPKAVVDDLKVFVKTGKFNIYQLRAKFLPVCIEYKLEEKSFWRWFQVKIGNWKA